MKQNVDEKLMKTQKTCESMPVICWTVSVCDVQERVLIKRRKSPLWCIMGTKHFTEIRARTHLSDYFKDLCVC